MKFSSDFVAIREMSLMYLSIKGPLDDPLSRSLNLRVLKAVRLQSDKAGKPKNLLVSVPLDTTTVVTNG